MFTEDLTEFIDTDDFAIAANYNSGTTVNGHFDNAYVDALGVSGANPVFLCAASAIPAAGVGNTLVVNSITYKIRNREPQDDGAFVLLQLEKQ